VANHSVSCSIEAGGALETLFAGVPTRAARLRTLAFMKKQTPNQTGQEGRGGLLERRRYLIDRFPVSFQGGASWHCQCREFGIANSCRHTREAAGMREAQAKILERVSGATSAFDRSVR
jgi:hypothetical protein